MVVDEPGLGLTRPEVRRLLLDEEFQHHLGALARVATEFRAEGALAAYKDTKTKAVTLSDPLLPPRSLLEQAVARTWLPPGDRIETIIDVASLVEDPETNELRPDLALLVHSHVAGAPRNAYAEGMPSLPDLKDAMHDFRELPGLIEGVLLSSPGFPWYNSAPTANLFLYRRRRLEDFDPAPVLDLHTNTSINIRRALRRAGVSYTDIMLDSRTMRPVRGMERLGSLSQPRHKKPADATT
jgi:hypothetical protein